LRKIFDQKEISKSNMIDVEKISKILPDKKKKEIAKHVE